MKSPKPRTPVTDLEKRALMALGRVKFPPATSSKRFARDNQGAASLTEGQRKFLWTICWHFRRQIHDEDVKTEAARWRSRAAESSVSQNATPEPAAEAPRYEPTPEDIQSLPTLFDGLEAPQ